MTQTASALRVLVADDDIDTLESTALLFQLHNCAVRAARNGVEALRHAEAFQPHLVVLDLGMPHPNGYEVARAIEYSSSNWSNDPTVVAVTGYSGPAVERRCAEVGFDICLTKPVSFVVLEQLTMLLDNKRKLRENTQAHRAALHSCIRLEIETSYTLLAVAATTTNPDTKRRCIEKALKARDKGMQWLKNATLLSSDERQDFDAALAEIARRYASLQRHLKAVGK
jgi:CheY-like chemotaxis protein